MARNLDDGLTIEITRLCTDGTRNVCSKLYSAVRRVAFAMGYDKVVTYTLDSEAGASLFAAGFNLDGKSLGGSWSRESRDRENNHPMEIKKRWIAKAAA